MDWTPELLRKEQEQDPDISEAFSWVENNQKPQWKDMRPKSPMLWSLWRQFESLFLRDNVFVQNFPPQHGVSFVLPDRNTEVLETTVFGTGTLRCCRPLKIFQVSRARPKERVVAGVEDEATNLHTKL